MSEIITIEGHARFWIVIPHRSNSARLWFYAPGLEVYVKGENASANFETIANIALNECIARNIPTISLKTVPLPENKYGGKKPPVPTPVKQLLLPFYDTTKDEKS